MTDMTNDTPLDIRPPQTKRGTERRAALLSAADELFLQRGYDAVSLDDLVAQVGGSKAAIYQYFGNKKGLLVSLVSFRCERFFNENELPRQLDQKNVRDVLVLLAHKIYAAFTCPDNIAFMRLIIQESQRDPEMAQLAYEAGPLRGLNDTANILRDAHVQGQIDCPQPFESAILFLGILRHSQWRLLVGLPPLEPHLNPEAYLNNSIDRFLAAHRVIS
jgi:AcrR family transcriptional regulator